MSQGRSNAYKLHDIRSVKDPVYGAKMDGSTDDLDALNAAIADINSGAIQYLYIPAGTMILSAEPDAITASDWAIQGAGAGATWIKFSSGAGTAGTFFTLGSSGTRAARAKVSDLALDCLNTSTLDGTANAFDLFNALDIRLTNLIVGKNAAGAGVNGFVKIGDNTAGTNGQNLWMTNVNVNMHGPAEGSCFDIHRGSVWYPTNVLVGVNTASVTGALKGIHFHPTGGTTTCDSGKWTAVEFNFPSDNVDNILVIDSSQGICVNQWFDSCVFDHSNVSGIKLLISAGAHASARMNNMFFNNCRSYIDGGGSVLIDDTGNRQIWNLQFRGGVYTAYDAAAVQITNSSTLQHVSIEGATFVDVENSTAKPCVSSKIGNLIVRGCRAQSDNSSDTCTFTYGVAFTASVFGFIVEGNDFTACTTADVDISQLGVSDTEVKAIVDNIASDNSFTNPITTTDATATVIASTQLTDERAYHVRAKVSGVKSDGSARASYELVGTFYRTGAGSATQQGSTTTVHSAESDATWDCVFDVTGNAVQVKVTGVAGTTIHWGCSLEQHSVS